MKKKTKQKFWSLLFEPVIKGAVVFSIFGVGVYAYAIAYPSPPPNVISGVVGKFVGLSEAGGVDYFYTTPIGSYELANAAACGSYSNRAHVCSVSEMLHNVAQENTLFPPLGDAFINGGPPGYFADLQDCNGWSTTSVSPTNNLARFWSFGSGYAKMGGCNASLQFACCI